MIFLLLLYYTGEKGKAELISRLGKVRVRLVDKGSLLELRRRISIRSIDFEFPLIETSIVSRVDRQSSQMYNMYSLRDIIMRIFRCEYKYYDMREKFARNIFDSVVRSMCFARNSGERKNNDSPQKDNVPLKKYTFNISSRFRLTAGHKFYLS